MQTFVANNCLYICILIHEHLFVNNKIEQIFGIYVCIPIRFMIKWTQDKIIPLHDLTGGTLWHMAKSAANSEKF